jgi:hypothetical protein
MDFQDLIGRKKFFARACAHAFENLQKLAVIAAIFSISLFSIVHAADQDTAFVLGQDSQIHSVALDYSQESVTRQNMGISDNCSHIKKRASAIPLIGSDGATLDARIQSTRGILVLEGLAAGQATPKVLYTQLLNPYNNYPTSISGEFGMLPGSRYPLALTLAASLVGSGDLSFQKGDSVIVHTDGQLFNYALPSITIPSGGLLRLYLGTDDTLYYDAALKHPFHSGACGGTHE